MNLYDWLTLEVDYYLKWIPQQEREGYDHIQWLFNQEISSIETRGS